MNFSWEYPMNEEEEKRMKEFIIDLHKGFKKWGGYDGDRFINHVFYMSIREVTRIIGGNAGVPSYCSVAQP